MRMAMKPHQRLFGRTYVVIMWAWYDYKGSFTAKEFWWVHQYWSTLCNRPCLLTAEDRCNWCHNRKYYKLGWGMNTVNDYYEHQAAPCPLACRWLSAMFVISLQKANKGARNPQRRPLMNNFPNVLVALNVDVRVSPKEQLEPRLHQLHMKIWCIVTFLGLTVSK